MSGEYVDCIHCVHTVCILCAYSMVRIGPHFPHFSAFFFTSGVRCPCHCPTDHRFRCCCALRQTRAKEEQRAALSTEAARLPPSIDRAVFVGRIMDIIRNVKKQQVMEGGHLAGSDGTHEGSLLCLLVIP
jgi:hypothetical protein